MIPPLHLLRVEFHIHQRRRNLQMVEIMQYNIPIIVILDYNVTAMIDQTFF